MHLTLLGSPRRCCDGRTRRETLRAGALGVLGGFALPELLRAEQARPREARPGKAKSVIVLYLLGSLSVAIIFNLIHNAYPHDWVLTAQVIAPAIASALMITPGEIFDHQPPHWVGGVVLFGYAIVTGAIGLFLTRRRDIS